jgi:uncharacterized Zn finger protein
MDEINISCPRCQGRVAVTKSRKVSSTVKEISYLCQNQECANVFVASLKMQRMLTFTLTISSPPDPEVSIELSRQVRQYRANYAH